MNIRKLGIAALTAATLAAALPAPAASTLKKIGNAIQYPVRKSASNLSIDAHRAINHKSVEHRRLGRYRRRNVVITPGGHIKPVHHSY